MKYATAYAMSIPCLCKMTTDHPSPLSAGPPSVTSCPGFRKVVERFLGTAIAAPPFVPVAVLRDLEAAEMVHLNPSSAKALCILPAFSWGKWCSTMPIASHRGVPSACSSSPTPTDSFMKYRFACGPHSVMLEKNRVLLHSSSVIILPLPTCSDDLTKFTSEVHVPLFSSSRSCLAAALSLMCLYLALCSRRFFCLGVLLSHAFRLAAGLGMVHAPLPSLLLLSQPPSYHWPSVAS